MADIGVKIRHSDDAVINLIEIPCNPSDCETCAKKDYCYIVTRPHGFEFVPSFTEIKWIYNIETNDFENTGLPMDWE